MSDAIETNFIRRLRHTPLRDLARGRISGRLDVRDRVNRADLPEPAKMLIARVVHRTRLWRMEKADVADELIAHFADAIEAGAGIHEAIEAFGNEKTAARLIARAKRRNRGWWWQVMRGFALLTLIVLLFYTVLAICYFTGQPRPSVDYLAIANRDALATPLDQRAWPVYRQALLDMAPRADMDLRDFERLLDSGPPGPQWQELAEWIRAHQIAIGRVRDASRLPTLGYVLGPTGAKSDEQLFGDGALQADMDITYVNTPLGQINAMRRLASILAADARIAIAQNDAQRWMSDLSAQFEMANQLGEERPVVAKLVAFGMRSYSGDQVKSLLSDRASLLGESDLQRLAHELAIPPDALDLSFDRTPLEDALQHMYTDNGHGDGWMTADGVAFLDRLGSANYAALDRQRRNLVMGMVGPSFVVLIASRAEVLTKFDEIVAAQRAAMSRPLYEIDMKALDDQVSDLDGLRYVPLFPFVRQPSSLKLTLERYLGENEGAMIGIAVEVYRRRHGAYPASLDELAPSLLPQVPVDRLNGKPLHYRLADGKPVVYSLGADGDDDGGRPPTGKDGRPQNLSAAGTLADNPIPDGDWIVYPDVPFPPGD